MGLERVQDVMNFAFDGSVALADYEVAAYVVSLDLLARLFAKVPVAWEVVTRRWELVKPYATTSHHLLVNLPHQYAECLARPKREAPWDMDGIFFSRGDFASVQNLRMHVGTYDVLTLRLQLLYDAPPKLLLQTLTRGRRTIPSNEGVATGSEMHWLLALAALRTGTNLDLVETGREFLATYAPYSPDLKARLELLNMYERLMKDPFEALKDAEATIERFEDEDQMLLSGMLNFYTAEMLIKRTGSAKLAAGFIRAAFTAYKLYQAAGLCEMLRDRYQVHCPSTPVTPRGPTDFLNIDVVPPPLRRESVSVSVSAMTNSDSTVVSRVNDDPTATESTSPFTDNNLDTLALMRSSLALAQEKDSLVLLCTLLRILCQFARCDYAAIGLSDEDDKTTLRLKAAGPFQRITSYDLDASDDAAQTVCPTSVMLHVARTGIPITKPAKASRLRNDPFYNGRQPRTLLCLPIINQGGQSGVILLLSMSSTSAAVQSESAREVVSTLATFAHIIHTHHVYTSRLKTEVTMRTRELSNALQAKTQFLSQCSHELRSPLAAIMGLASVLETSSGLTAVQHEHLQTIIASGQDLLALISNILDHSKLESNSVQLESIPFSVREVVEGALDIIAPVAQSKNVELTVLTTLKSDPPGVIGDPFRVKQVLLNLLSNAVKFTPPGQAGRRTARVTVDRTWEDLGDGRIKVALTVADTGVGIPASKLHKLFKSFSQVDESITRSYGGSGLGLVISRDLARLLGGDCTVESEFGKGSTFTFTFIAQQDPSWQPTKLRRFETTQDIFILSGGDMMWGHVLEEDLKEFNCRPTWFTEPLPAALTPGHPLGFNSGRYYQGIILDTSLIEPVTLKEIKRLQPNAKVSPSPRPVPLTLDHLRGQGDRDLA
jgi:signal transduction histidine kinase